jgi:hypothetical protein
MATADAIARVKGYLPRSAAVPEIEGLVGLRADEALGLWFPDLAWSQLSTRQKMIVGMQGALSLIPAARDWFAKQLIKATAEGTGGEFTRQLDGLRELEAGLQVQLDRALVLEGLAGAQNYSPDAGWLLASE